MFKNFSRLDLPTELLLALQANITLSPLYQHPCFRNESLPGPGSHNHSPGHGSFGKFPGAAAALPAYPNRPPRCGQYFYGLSGAHYGSRNFLISALTLPQLSDLLYSDGCHRESG